MKETKEQRTRRQAAERQQRKRDREKEHRERVGAQVMKWETYQGTRDDLETMRAVGEFEEIEEALTLGVRYLANMARHDPDAFRATLDPRKFR